MSSGEHPITIPEFDQEDDDLFQKLREKNAQEEEKNAQEEEKTGSIGPGQGSNPVTKIQKVPRVMKTLTKKRWKKEYFVPQAIAIGPIHAHPEDLLVGEDLKLTWAAKYLDGLDGKKILQEIRGEIKSLMEKFDEKCLDKDENTLARMLFVDGCAMLQFIYSFVWDDIAKHLEIDAAQAILVQQDLFLLENQIPFRVLQIIMNAGKNKQQKVKEIEELTKMETAVQVFIHLSKMSTTEFRPEISLKFDGVVHLLDLLRRSLLDDSAQSDGCSYSAFNCLRSFVKFSVFVIFKLPFYVLGILVCPAATIVVTFFYIIYRFIHFLKRSANTPSPYSNFVALSMFICLSIGGFESPKCSITRRTFPNVQQLKASGIELKPSKSRCLTKVSFSSGLLGGCLRLCPIRVDKSTAGKLLNLMAYEMCPDYYCKITEDSKSFNFSIISYVGFLDSLIDNEQDVKDLKAANIIRHRLSSDVEVAELFNNIGPDSVPDDAYGYVNNAIQEYSLRKIPFWIAELRQKHVVDVAFIATVAALVLTAAQTYYTISPR